MTFTSKDSLYAVAHRQAGLYFAATVFVGPAIDGWRGYTLRAPQFFATAIEAMNWAKEYVNRAHSPETDYNRPMVLQAVRVF